jgi:hypothetical protein
MAEQAIGHMADLADGRAPGCVFELHKKPELGIVGLLGRTPWTMGGMHLTESERAS